MNRHELLDGWPRNGSDVERARKLVSLGFPAVTPVLKDMVDWLKSPSPVARVFQEFLCNLGEPALPFVREALIGKHEAQKHIIVRHVLPHWPRSAVQQISDELDGLLQSYGYYSIDVWALSLIVKHDLPTHTPVKEWLENKFARINEQRMELERLLSIRGDTSARVGREE